MWPFYIESFPRGTHNACGKYVRRKHYYKNAHNGLCAMSYLLASDPIDCEDLAIPKTKTKIQWEPFDKIKILMLNEKDISYFLDQQGYDEVVYRNVFYSKRFAYVVALEDPELYCDIHRIYNNSDKYKTLMAWRFKTKVEEANPKQSKIKLPRSSSQARMERKRYIGGIDKLFHEIALIQERELIMEDSVMAQFDNYELGLEWTHAWNIFKRGDFEWC